MPVAGPIMSTSEKMTAASTKRKSTGNLPDFIVIGAMKSGTTSLQGYLDGHPEIAMAPKELNFFSDGLNWHRGMDWYRGHFRNPGLIQGEISPSYSKCHLYPEIPRKIHEAIPDVKLIYVVREPVARIISHHSHSIGADTLGRDPDQILADSIENYINTSRYTSQIKCYLEFFDRSQVLIVSSERLRDDRIQTLQRIFRFVGARQSYESSQFHEERHDSSVKVKRNFIGRLLGSHPVLSKVETFLKAIVPRSLYPLAGRLMGSRFEKPQVTPELRTRIVASLDHEITDLRKLTGDDFSEWDWDSTGTSNSGNRQSRQVEDQ